MRNIAVQGSERKMPPKEVSKVGQRKMRGFTLIELMVTILVLAILIAIGAPSFTSVIQSNRTASLANGMVGAIQLARSEAVKRQQNVAVCPLDDSGDDCADSSDWSHGWQVRTVAGETIQEWSVPQTNEVTSSSNELVFAASGLRIQPDPTVTSDAILVVKTSGCSDGKQTTLTINPLGHVMKEDGTCQSS